MVHARLLADALLFRFENMALNRGASMLIRQNALSSFSVRSFMTPPTTSSLSVGSLLRATSTLSSTSSSSSSSPCSSSSFQCSRMPLSCAFPSKSTDLLQQQIRSFSTTGGDGLYRRVGGYGYPMMYIVTFDRPSWQPDWEDEYEVIPRDEFGVPAQIPPEVSTNIKHVYQVPPQYFPFLKKLGDDTEALKPYTQKLIQGDLTFDDYEEMFYKFTKPLKIYRKLIPKPYRTADEMANEDEVKWESAWLSYRQRVLGDYNTRVYLREYVTGALLGIYCAWLWLSMHRQYRIDMKLFYVEAPECKLNWVKPRGDLV